MKPPMKSASNNYLVFDYSRQRTQMFRTQLGVGMMKAKPRSVSDSGANIQLPASGRFIAGNQTNRATPGQLV
jgi:hypothetical protein